MTMNRGQLTPAGFGAFQQGCQETLPPEGLCVEVPDTDDFLTCPAGRRDGDGYDLASMDPHQYTTIPKGARRQLLQQSQEGTSTAWHLSTAKSTHPSDVELHRNPPMIFPSE